MRCENVSCPTQVRRRIEHFACRSGMDITGLGTALVDQLVRRGLVRDYGDLFFLKEEDLAELDRMGKKSASNLMDSIRESKARPFERVLFALGIRQVGLHAARLLASEFGSMDELANASLEDISSIAGVGPVIAESVRRFFEDEANAKVVRKLRRAGVRMSRGKPGRRSQPLVGKTFVITGTLSRHTREEATELITSRGGRVSASVSGKTDYCLVGRNPGSKKDRAETLKVQIIDEEEFERLTEEG